MIGGQQAVWLVKAVSQTGAVMMLDSWDSSSWQALSAGGRVFTYSKSNLLGIKSLAHAVNFQGGQRKKTGSMVP